MFKKIKGAVIPAALGFFLSFLISIICTRQFGHSIFKAFLFGIGFGILGFVGKMIFKTFLETEGSSSDISSPAREKHVVDFTLEGENLTEESDAPNFNVDVNQQPLAESATTEIRTEVPGPSVSAKKIDENEVMQAGAGEKTGSENSGFQAMSLDQMAKSKPDSVEKKDHEVSRPVKEDVDNLPDIGVFETDGPVETQAQEYEDDLVEDSEFTSVGVSSPKDENPAANHDVETIAKAISTALKRDEV